MVLLLSALVFYWGGTLLSRREVDITALYASFEAVIIAAFSAGRLFTFVPDYGRATNSFKTVSGWINRKPRVADTKGLPPLDPSLRAKVENGSYAAQDVVLRDIELRYPQRPNHPALKELSITIPAGKSVAFCGTSGSGKSSILALLQRFYDPCQGSIEFGGVDVRQVPIDMLRREMAYVSQDPILYEGTIRWNLSLGSSDPESVTQADLEKACEDAYILDFVRGLPNGFDTEIGFKGSQLSGETHDIKYMRTIVLAVPALQAGYATHDSWYCSCSHECPWSFLELVCFPRPVGWIKVGQETLRVCGRSPPARVSHQSAREEVVKVTSKEKSLQHPAGGMTLASLALDWTLKSIEFFML
ncbi:hypothetical protein L1887_55065 [Cichorium endivia]|nr:hypothetical protein L1887_55065 [Cichorium endivia]